MSRFTDSKDGRRRVSFTVHHRAGIDEIAYALAWSPDHTPETIRIAGKRAAMKAVKHLYHMQGDDGNGWGVVEDEAWQAALKRVAELWPEEARAEKLRLLGVKK